MRAPPYLSTDVSLVCVGTPSAPAGVCPPRYLEQATDEIGAALAEKDGWHVVVYRSTMVPGTCENLLIPRLESASGKRAGRRLRGLRESRVPARGNERSRLS